MPCPSISVRPSPSSVISYLPPSSSFPTSNGAALATSRPLHDPSLSLRSPTSTATLRQMHQNYHCHRKRLLLSSRIGVFSLDLLAGGVGRRRWKEE